MRVGPRAMWAACALLAACGGGGDAPAPSPSPSPTPSPAPPTTAARVAAASATARSASNACAGIAPFYWEIGDASGTLGSASIDGATGTAHYTATTAMPIASASKWVYGAYVAQRRAGALTDSDVKFLNFRSGYTNFDACGQTQTIDSCLATGTNGVHSDATDGYFFYNGGHMQEHASLMGLGALNNAALAQEVQSQLGTDFVFVYSQPQPAGGVATSPAQYAGFLRKMLAGQLQMAALLGSHPVCTNPATCSQALASPATGLSWHYSIGHWVEDDPATSGDGAFSSAGAFGFYPWIDASKSWYGIVARVAAAGSGFDSAQCGALIRRAWVSGTAVP